MANHVIIVGFDGLRPDAITPEDAPNLSAFLASSALCTNHRAVYPTETRVNLTAIGTGGTAGEHGIVANELMSRSVRAGEMLSTGSIADLRALDAAAGGRLVGLKPASSILAEAGRTCAILSTGAEGSWRLMSWQADRNGHFGFNPHAPAHTSPAADLATLEARFGIAAVRDNLHELITRVFIEHAWPTYKPALSVVWFAETDKASHLHGPGSPQLREALRSADAQLGQILAWRDAQPEADEIAVICMSDHGHMSIGGKVSVVDTLRAAGFKAAGRMSGDVDIGVVSGSSTNIWFRTPDLGLMQAAPDALAEQPWFACGLSRSIDGGDFGQVAGTFSYAAVQTESALSPDLVVLFRGDAARNPHGAPGTAFADIGARTYPIGGGYHGGLHPMELRCLLAVNASEVTPGRYEQHSNTADVLPTVLALLNVDAEFRGSGAPVAAVRGDAAQSVRDLQSVTIGGVPRYLERVRVGGRVYLDGIAVGVPPTEMLLRG